MQLEYEKVGEIGIIKMATRGCDRCQEFRFR